VLKDLSGFLTLKARSICGETSMIQPGLAKIEGFVKITDPGTGQVLVDKKNAIHYENISIAMAETLSNRTLAQGGGFILKMAFGNGGSSVDPTGVITYLPPMLPGKMLTCTMKLMPKWSMTIQQPTQILHKTT
jgi:hypothetical protein